jgi:Zn-dependent protease
MRKFKCSVTPGFLLLLALLLYWDEALFLPGILACVLHECGHLLGIWMAGGRMRWLRFTAVGGEMGIDPALPLSYGGEVLATLAGPAASLLAAAVGGSLQCYLFAGISLAFGLFNLLPVRLLDGGRCLYFLAAMLWSPDTSRYILFWSSAIVSSALMGGGVFLMLKYLNPTLLLTSAWLLLQTMGRTENNPCFI